MGTAEEAGLSSARLERNPPRFSALCGLDDFYSRNSHTGPNFERMMATMAAGYGSSDLPRALAGGSGKEVSYSTF